MTGTAPLDDLAVKARRVHEAVTLVRGRVQSVGGHVTATHRAACAEAEEAAQALRDELAADPRVAQVIAGTRTTAPAAPRHHPGPEEDDDAYYATRSILRSS
ncbi:hypothetical protein [Prescottella defluvii]|uniref:hypothetical protein n=1 Tax=Prescottella defluvii TaxID=1323361 RepID=UPI000AB4C63A|nr:hypothetical protein [Prescottella defluvii]